jgi:hypothetical protein
MIHEIRQRRRRECADEGTACDEKRDHLKEIKRVIHGNAIPSENFFFVISGIYFAFLEAMHAMISPFLIPLPLASSLTGDWLNDVLRLGSLLAGIWLLWAAITAAVGVMLVPRPTAGFLARILAKSLHLFFHFCASRMKNYGQIDRFLAAQGPSTVLLFLAVFLGIFVGAFALLFYGVSGLTFPQALLQAGSGLTTLGITEALGPLGLAVVFAAAFMGSTVIAVFIGYLLTLYSAYTARESLMSEVALLCGEPAWGPEFLVRLKLIKGSLDTISTDKLVTWMCTLRVTHYIYSILSHFRSPIPKRHWVTVLLTMLDAAAIRLAVMEEEPDLRLIRFIAEGAETLHAIKLAEIARTNARLDTEGLSTWRIESEILHSKSESTGPIQEPGISRSEWDWAMAFMADNGISLRKDREESWRTFCKLRSHYYQPAYFLADTLFAIQAPWSGPRNMSAAKNFQTVWPMLAMQRREDTETSKGKINLPTV